MGFSRVIYDELINEDLLLKGGRLKVDDVLGTPTIFVLVGGGGGEGCKDWRGGGVRVLHIVLARSHTRQNQGSLETFLFKLSFFSIF